MVERFAYRWQIFLISSILFLMSWEFLNWKEIGKDGFIRMTKIWFLGLDSPETATSMTWLA